MTRPAHPLMLVTLPAVLALLAAPLSHAASPPSSAPRGPAQEPTPAAPVAVQNLAQEHPASEAEALPATEPVTVAFADAVAATAAAGTPADGELRFHIQGEPPDQSGVSGSGNGAGGGGAAPTALPPVSEPPIALGAAGALSPGDTVAQFQGLSATGWIPPDTVMAVGPSSVVEATNSGFAVYSKSGGSLQGYATFSTFFSPALPSGWQGFLFDPRVVYSAENSRFVMLALGKDSINQTSYFFIAVSQSTDPTGNWWMYRYSASSPNPSDSDSWADYCGLGADSWGAYVTCNLFYWAGGFKYAKLWSIGPAIFSGGSGAGWSFWDLRWNSGAYAFALQPVHPYTIAGDGAMFFVNSYVGSGSSALLWEMTGDRTDNPTLSRSTISVQSYYSIGNNVDQPGSSTDIDGGDTRIQNAAYSNRKVYAVLTTDPYDDASQAGWLVLKLDVDSNGLDWQHLVYSGPGFYYIYPAITLDGHGGTAPNLAIFGTWTDTETTVTSTTYYASGLFKIYDDQPNSSSGPFITFQSGLASYVSLDGSRNRWGDYSGAGFDWSTGKAWGAVETAGTSNNWRTYLRGMDIASTATCTADGFEDDDSSGQASTLTSGSYQSHSICPAGDLDWAKLTLAAESAVVLETSGQVGDTVMTLYNSSLSQIDYDDDGGSGLFSRIERTCGVDALPAGTYYVKVGEFGDNDEIADYSLYYAQTATCGSCSTDLVLANTTLSGAVDYRASNSVTLGPSLVVNGSPIRVYAGDHVVLYSSTQIGGTFSATVTSGACTAAPSPGGG